MSVPPWLLRITSLVFHICSAHICRGVKIKRMTPMSEGGEGVSAISRVEVTTSGDRVFSAGSRGRFIRKLLRWTDQNSNFTVCFLGTLDACRS